LLQLAFLAQIKLFLSSAGTSSPTTPDFARFIHVLTMLRPRRDTKIPLRYRLSSPPQLSTDQPRIKRVKIDDVAAERANVDHALAPIAAPSESTDEPLTLLANQLPQFEANYVPNRAGASRYTALSEIELFCLFFNDVVVEILAEETNKYATFHLAKPPLSEFTTRR
jgi:hypothetical protein